MARTPKAVEDRREQIISAAMRVFAQKGFARATNRDIANEAGITTGLIYYYFKSKEDLLREALEERSPMQIMAQVTTEMLEQPPDTLLPIMLKRVLDVVEDEQFISLIRILLPEMLHGDAEVAPIAQSLFQRLGGFLSNYLETQIARGSARSDLNVGTTTQVLISSMIGMVLRRQIMRDPTVLRLTHEEIVQAVLDLALPGIQLH